MKSAELILNNARIYTLDGNAPWAESVAIAGGKVLAVGSTKDIEGLKGPDTRCVDLDGRMAMPGINDSHCHVFEGTRSLINEVQITPAHSFREVLDAVGKAARSGKRPWVTGGVWAPALAREFSSGAALAALDAVSGSVPVLLRDLTFHSRIANSAALALAGIDSTTPDPDSGVIVRDVSNSKPTGLLHESAGFIVDELVPVWTEDENLEAARAGTKLYNGFGITGFQIAAASRTTLSVYHRLDSAGELSAWVAMYIAMKAGIALDRDGIGEDVVTVRSRYATDHIKTDFAKFFMDGVPGMRTSAYIEPYLAGPNGESDYLVRSFYAVSDLAEQIVPLDREGLTVKIHAIGDRAIRDTLDAIAIVRDRNGKGGPQHQIAHVNYVTDEDIPRLRELNVMADLCPPMWFPSVSTDMARQVLGEARVARSWPIRRIIESGADAAAGSDWPAISPSPNPWPGLSSIVTRKNPFTGGAEVHVPSERIDLATAIRLFTINSSRAMRLGDQTGSIEPGKYADIIVLDRNLFAVPPEEIAETKVLATLFKGRCVHGSLEF